MSDTQFYLSVAVMPTVTIIIVLIGVLLNNTNMNARLNDMRGEMNARFEDLRNALRAEMSKNHSEMMAKFGELDSRLSAWCRSPAQVSATCEPQTTKQTQFFRTPVESTPC